MFEAFFNFTKSPFRRDIAADALYMTPQFKSLRDRITHAAQNRCFLLLSGDPGAGKSTLLRHFRGCL